MLFFSEREHGRDVLRACFDALHHIPRPERLRKVSQWLDVPESTLKRWLSPTGKPPRAACFALWHECHTGREFMRLHHQNEAANLHGLVNCQRQQIEELQRQIDALSSEPRDCANDPYGFAYPRQTPELGRPLHSRLRRLSRSLDDSPDAPTLPARDAWQ